MDKRKTKKNLEAIKKRTAPYRWKKGQTGNPKGQPRKLPRLDVILTHVLGYNEGEPEESSPINEILTAMYKQAKKGNIQAANLLLDRYNGKVKQTNVIVNGGVSKEDVGALFPFAPPHDKE